jgi:AcrR family transcriptional regulator
VNGFRQRFRDQVRDEVKDVALTQLAEGGVEAVSINAIARALGVSGPSLYRYFASRDALLTELVVDAYADLEAAVSGAADLSAFATRFRGWALAHPARYRLLFAAPPEGRDEVPDAIIDASVALMRTLVPLIGAAAPAPPAALRAELERWARCRDLDVSPAVGLRAVLAWSRLHGFVSLEIEGNFASMGLDADKLFAAELAVLDA